MNYQEGMLRKKTGITIRLLLDRQNKVTLFNKFVKQQSIFPRTLQNAAVKTVVFWRSVNSAVRLIYEDYSVKKGATVGRREREKKF